MSLAPAVLRSTSTLGYGNAGVDIPIGNRFVIAGARLRHRDGRMSTISVVESISATTLVKGEKDRSANGGCVSLTVELLRPGFGFNYFKEYRIRRMLCASRMTKRILVVEDDADLRRLFRTALSMAGYQVDEAADGLDALRIIENRVPDLVVLDLMLQTLDGQSVQQDLAARALTRNIPIVVVTGSSMEIAGVNVSCVLRKPIMPDQLVETVRHCIVRGVSGAGA